MVLPRGAIAGPELRTVSPAGVRDELVRENGLDRYTGLGFDPVIKVMEHDAADRLNSM